MPELNYASILFLIGVAALTLAAAAWDLRTRRIPNKLTVPAFCAGLVYQAVFHGWAGLGDAGLAFLVAFGLFFILWVIGGGGGGDVKLMGALSVWLGFKLTLMVIVLSTVFVLVGTLSVMLRSVFRRGMQGTKNKFLATGRGAKAPPETPVQRQKRRIMAYAVPVALATWVILLLDATTFQGGRLP